MSKKSRKDIGEALRRHRLAAGMSQMALAEKIGVSYQQLQKYEKGINNISAYRLKQISEALKVPVNSFLEEIGSEHVAEEMSEYGLNKEEKKLLDFFRRIDNEDIRRGLLRELKGIAEIMKKT
ncbi:MAG: helix-turn-helix transcriptional regulator [Nitrospirota bacterium]